MVGHGPHDVLPVEVYRGRAILYGLGSFSFHTGHGGRAHGNWIGMMARAQVAAGAISDVRFRFVRHNARNETVPCRLADESAELDDVAARSAAYGTSLGRDGEEVVVALTEGTGARPAP
ncbi:MAG: hypothetical protein WDN25_06200 [Acetobacteraceae bacterium]